MTFTSVGKTTLQSLMSRDYVAISDRETVGSTVEVLRRRKADFQVKFAYLYVTDRDEKLVGVLRTRDLLAEAPELPISHVMKQPVLHLVETASINEALDIFRTHSFFALPVTDKAHRLKGIIAAKSLEERMGVSIRSGSRALDHLDQEEIETRSVHEIILKRLPWLLISVASGLVCAYILGLFIGRIESIVALILFVPVILGLSGNVGTQLGRICLRSLREEELPVRKLVKFLFKEMAIGVVMGFIILVLAALIAILWRKIPIEGIALGISIASVTTVSGILGIVLPISFKALRINSHFASGLFLLLICDIVALILYFMISLSLISPTLELGYG